MIHGIKGDWRRIHRDISLSLFSQMVLLLGLFSSPVGAEGPLIDLEKRGAALQKEAYYDFFLGDYLTSATRLKLVEETTGNSDKVLNDTRLLLGGLYIAWGMYNPATVLFDRWVEQFPLGSSRNQLLLLIERLQYRRALYRAAIETSELLIPDKMFSSMDQARYLAGMSHYILGSFQEGIRAMESIPPSSVYFSFAQMAMAQSYAQLGDFEKSIGILKSLGGIDRQRDPDKKVFAEKSRLILGLLVVELGRFQEARTVLSSIPTTSPFYPDALFGEGWADFNAGRYSEALPLFQELFEMFPDHPYALEGLITIGGSYQRLGAVAKSLQIYGEALEVYGRKEKEIREFQTLIQNRDQLADWLNRFDEVQEDRWVSLLDDDLLRFRIGQYRDLSALSAYLNRKLADMGVFEIMVDHREEVFRGHLPTLRRFLDDDPVKTVQEEKHLLQTRIETAIQKEEVSALASSREREEFDQLARAESKGRALQQAIEQSGSPSPELLQLKMEMETANRRLVLVHGELLWKVITEAPGRIDDLQSNARKLDEGLENLSRQKARLTASIPSLEGNIGRFRQRIHLAHQALLKKKEMVLDLQRRLLPPLQSLLLETLEKKRGKIEALEATAQLSRIQILDLKSQP